MKRLIIATIIPLLATPAAAQYWGQQPDQNRNNPPNIIAPLMEHDRYRQEQQRRAVDSISQQIHEMARENAREHAQARWDRLRRDYIAIGNFSREGTLRFIRNHPDMTTREIQGVVGIWKMMR